MASIVACAALHHPACRPAGQPQGRQPSSNPTHTHTHARHRTATSLPPSAEQRAAALDAARPAGLDLQAVGLWVRPVHEGDHGAEQVWSRGGGGAVCGSWGGWAGRAVCSPRGHGGGPGGMERAPSINVRQLDLMYAVCILVYARAMLRRRASGAGAGAGRWVQAGKWPPGCGWWWWWWWRAAAPHARQQVRGGASTRRPDLLLVRMLALECRALRAGPMHTAAVGTAPQLPAGLYCLPTSPPPPTPRPQAVLHTAGPDGHLHPHGPRDLHAR